jgi:hypothetical protein
MAFVGFGPDGFAYDGTGTQIQHADHGRSGFVHDPGCHHAWSVEDQLPDLRSQ